MAEDNYLADGPDEPAANEDTAGLDRKLKAWFRQDFRHSSSWRKEAKEDFNFYSNDQWSEDDRKTLEDMQRPALTFNRVAPLVNAVVGSEINNRREVRYFPREAGDAAANEVLTAAGEWFRDECGAEDEESDAFQDATICGMGWTDTRLDFDEDPDGSPVVERIDSLEMVWDCNASKPNLTDARRLWRIRDVPYDEAVELTGVKDRKKLHAAWVKSDADTDQHDQDSADKYDGSQDDHVEKSGSYKKCKLLEARWLENETYYRGPNPETGEVKEFKQQEVDLLKRAYPNYPFVKQTRKVVRRVFIGAEVLGKPDKPLVPAGMFGWECVTGYRDKIKGTFYGIVRAAKDPQRWSNKFFSQVQWLLNSQAKGGVMAERGAAEDEGQFESSWAKSDATTWVNPGSLSGDKPKIVPKPAAQFPAGFWTLFQEAKEEISQVTGLSPEFIGTREVEQAGVLEYQRRQSSLNLLASLFNSLRRYRKRQGKVMLYLIQNHLADGRLVRIVSDEQKKYVPLTKEHVASSTYDIIVDDSPTSPNEKDRTWQILMQMLPMVKELVTPEVALELLEFSPVPSSLVEKLKKKAEEAAQQPKPPTPEEQKMKIEAMKAEADMALKQADAKIKAEEIAAELAMKREEHAMTMAEMKLDAQIKIAEANAKMDVERTRADHDQKKFDLESRNIKQQADIKRAEAGLPAESEMSALFAQLAESQRFAAKAVADQGGLIADGFGQIAKVMAAPNEVVRDAKGKAVGSRKVFQ